MSEQILIDPGQAQAYGQVLVQEIRRAAHAVGDELLLGPSQQDFCACEELRSTLPWLDAELTEVHDQVIRGLNRIASAGMDAVNRAAQLRAEETVATTVSAPGAPVDTTPSAVTVTTSGAPMATTPGAPVVPTPSAVTVPAVSANQAAQLLNAQTPDNPWGQPDDVSLLGFNSGGDEIYTGPAGGESTEPTSPALD